MKNLKRLRERANLSVKDLALKLNVTPRAVGKGERCASYPHGERSPELATILGCTTDALYGRDAESG